MDPLSALYALCESHMCVSVWHSMGACAVWWGCRLSRVWERQAHTPVITLASDAGREEIPPTVLSEPKLPSYVVVLNLSFSACKWGESQVHELNAWLGLELHFPTH